MQHIPSLVAAVTVRLDHLWHCRHWDHRSTSKEIWPTNRNHHPGQAHNKTWDAATCATAVLQSAHITPKAITLRMEGCDCSFCHNMQRTFTHTGFLKAHFNSITFFSHSRDASHHNTQCCSPTKSRQSHKVHQVLAEPNKHHTHASVPTARGRVPHSKAKSVLFQSTPHEIAAASLESWRNNCTQHTPSSCPA